MLIYNYGIMKHHALFVPKIYSEDEDIPCNKHTVYITFFFKIVYHLLKKSVDPDQLASDAAS